MAGRRTKHNVDYFPHHNGMRNDRKIKALRTKFGNEGYAIYNMMLEVLAEADCLMVKLDEVELLMLSGDFGINVDLLKSVIEFCCNVNLFQKNKDTILCEQLDKRLGRVFKKRKHDLGNLRSENTNLRSENTNLRRKNRVSGEKSTQSKVKQSKVKKPSAKNLLKGFEEFWNIYDKKRGKVKCQGKWKRLSIKDKKTILEFIPRYVEYTPDPQYRQNPSTFLNQRVWDDDIEDHAPKGAQQELKSKMKITIEED